MLESLDRAIVWTTAVLCAALMAAMTGVVLLGVFFRYVLSDALPWPEEFARFSMIWVTMLGAGLVMRYGGHIAVGVVVDLLPGVTRRIAILLARGLMLVFLLMVLVYGFDMTKRVQRQTAPAMGVSLSVPNAALPIGAALMIYHLVMLTVRREPDGGKPPQLPLG